MMFLQMKIIVILCLIFLAGCQCDTSTILQLRSSVNFSYSLTNWFLDLIRGSRPPTVIIEAYVNLMLLTFCCVWRPIGLRMDIDLIVTSYLGFGICAVLGITFVVMMPIIGLIFCCARSCGKCGGQLQLMDSRQDRCRRIVYTVCVLIIVTVQFVATVLVSINHFLLHAALTNSDTRIGALSQMNLSLVETSKALDDMHKMAMNTSSVDLNDRKERFMGIVDEKLKQFQIEFYRVSEANLVSTPIHILQSTALDFAADSEAEKLLMNFNKSFNEVVHKLPSIRRNIIDSLDPNCPFELHLKCNQLMHIAQTKLKLRYEPKEIQINEVFTLLNQLSQHSKAFDDLDEFNKTLNRLDRVVKEAVEESLYGAWTDLADSRPTREKLAQSFEGYVKKYKEVSDLLQMYLDIKTNPDSNDIFIRSMESRLYGGIALLCIPVLIVLLVYLGLCFGTCGHRPYEEAGVCNRGVGANLLLAAVGFIFLFSSILMVTCTVLFLAGGPLQTDGCRYLTGHISDGPLLLDKYVHKSIKFIIEKINRDATLRQELNLNNHQQYPDQRFTSSDQLETLKLLLNVSRARPLDAILKRCEKEPFVDAISGGQLTFPVLHENIQSMLQKVVDSFENVDLVQPLNRTIELCTTALKNLAFLERINFVTAVDQLDSPVTEINSLVDYTKELRSLKMAVLDPHIADLDNFVVSLDKMRPKMRQLYLRLEGLPVQYRLLTVNMAQYDKNMSNAVRVTMKSDLERLKPLLGHQLHLAVIATWRDIPCKSLRLAVKRGVDAVCITTLMPLNALWAGLGVTLLLFIPLIVCAVKLAGLYRKTEKYSPDYDEPKTRNKPVAPKVGSHDLRSESLVMIYALTSKVLSVIVKVNLLSVGKYSSGSSFVDVFTGKQYKGRKRSQNEMRNNSNSRYHQVSVYPYDAYE